MYLRFAILFQLFSFISGPEFSFNEFIRSAVMGELLNSPCTRSEKNFPNFMFFSRNHPENPQILVQNEKKILKLSDFNSKRPTKIIIHGFLDSIRISDWMQRMKTKLLEVDDCNVIIVDWSCGNFFPYARAIDNSKIVSKELVELIKLLQVESHADPSTFHLIGHSMGPHIAARVGHAIPNLGRITALDPALPRFYRMPIEERLDSSDAKFVDVIHSDAGYSIFEGIGIRTKIGHLDFFPNGGNNQPGCKQSPFDVFPRVGFFNGLRYYMSCDHHRAIEFYIESIQSMASLNSSHNIQCHPVAVACKDWNTFSKGKCATCSPDDCVIMGYNSNLFPDIKISNREYFLQTFEEAPFCTFQYQVIVETESAQNAINDGIGMRTSNINRGIIRLELEAHDGGRTRLDDTETKEMKPDSDYVYLATSRSYIEAVQRANFWLDSLTNSNLHASARTHPANLKRIKVIPIQLQMLPWYSASPSVAKEIVMCGLYNKVIEVDKRINLTVGDC